MLQYVLVWAIKEVRKAKHVLVFFSIGGGNNSIECARFNIIMSLFCCKKGVNDPLASYFVKGTQKQLEVLIFEKREERLSKTILFFIFKKM